jgi:hypothetical protein
VEGFDLRPSNQYILARAIPSFFHFKKMCLCQVSLLSRCSPRCLTSFSGKLHIVYMEWGVYFSVVIVTWIDLDLLAFILNFLN